MMRWSQRVLFCLVLFCVSVPVFSTISAQLELVLSDEGTLLHGKQDLTINLHNEDKVLLWTESYKSIYFVQGIGRIQLGKTSNINPFDFYAEGIQLSVQINDDTLVLPLHSIPFSMYSYASDLVNYIHMDGVFHTNINNKSVGININYPTPNSKLEVNGAVKLGDIDSEERGTIRWRNQRLEGRYNLGWEFLDVRPDDQFSSKWTENEHETAFYVASNVLINTTHVNQALNVGGKVVVYGDLYVHGLLSSAQSVMDSYNYEVHDGLVKITRLSLLNNNSLTKNGLQVSGQLLGDGFGVMGIGSDNIKVGSIYARHILNEQITNPMLMDNVILGNLFSKRGVSSVKLSSDVQLDVNDLSNVVLSSNNIQLNSISVGDFSITPPFDYNLFEFTERSIGGGNFLSRSIDPNKVTPNTLEQHDFNCNPCFSVDDQRTFSAGFVLSKHISPNSIVASHFEPGTIFDFSKVSFNVTVGIAKGGTGSRGFDPNQWITVSGNQLVSSPIFIDKNKGLGFGSFSNLLLDISLDSSGLSVVPLLLTSSVGLDHVGFELGNAITSWQLRLDSNQSLSIASQVSNAPFVDSIAMDSSGSNATYGIGAAPNEHTHLNLGGAITLGGELGADTGALYYEDGEFHFYTPGQTIITLNVVSSDRDVPSYLYASHISNESRLSRVLLGERLVLEGDSHVVMGGTDMLFSGGYNIGRMGEDSVFFGQFNALDYALSSVVFADNVYLNFGLGTSVVGDDHVVMQDRYDRIGGVGHHVGYSSFSDVQGKSHVVLFGNYLDTQGASHDVSFVDRATIHGEAHQVHHSREVQLQGRGALVSFSSVLNIEGGLHSVEQVKDATISGERHVVFGSTGDFFGDRHSVVLGNGKYNGRGVWHVGGGAPDVKGNHNVLLGEHHGTVVSNGHMSIGASQLDSYEFDGGIVLHAPGGLEIESKGVTVAHLGAHAGSWSHVSDQFLKSNIRSIYPVQILDKVSHMDISEWQYHGQEYVSHIGPMAQDFFELFSLGNNMRYIQSVDMDGVILSSIQGLGKRWRHIQGRQVQTVSQMTELQSTLNILSKKMEVLEEGVLSDLDSQLTGLFQSMHEDEQQQMQDVRAISDWMQSIQRRLEVSK
jgi:hypothetical protein